DQHDALGLECRRRAQLRALRQPVVVRRSALYPDTDPRSNIVRPDTGWFQVLSATGRRARMIQRARRLTANSAQAVRMRSRTTRMGAAIPASYGVGQLPGLMESGSRM